MLQTISWMLEGLSSGTSYECLVQVGAFLHEEGYIYRSFFRLEINMAGVSRAEFSHLPQ